MKQTVAHPSNLIQFKCTEQQSEILSACLIGGDDANRAFNQSITLKFTGDLRIDILQQALTQLVERNECFRTSFDLTNNLCLIAPPQAPVLTTISRQTSDQAESILKDLKRSFAATCFDLQTGPLYQFHLLSCQQVHYLSLVAHHVVCDGWTLGLIINELGLLYNAQLDTSVSVHEPQRYVDFAAAEASYQTSEQFISVKNFWKQLFKDFKPVPALPYASSHRPSEYVYKSAHITYPLNAEQFQHLRHISDQVGCSLLVTMVSVFEVLLYRKSGATSFVTGLPTAGQPLLNMNHLMGHCVNMIPMLCHVQGQQSFTQYLTQRKADFKTAFDNRHITFGTLLKHIRIDRGQSTLPLIPVTFNIDRELIGDSLLRGLSTELTINTREYSSFDMILNVSRVKDQLTIECDYNEALFNSDDVTEMLDQYRFLINTICKNGEQRISDCDLTDPSAVIASLSDFNATQAEYPSEQSLYQLIQQRCSEQPQAIALRFNDKSITYQQLIEAVDTCASGLYAAGLQPGMRAGVMLDRGPELVISLLAVMRLGAAYVPIDPIFPEQRIRYMLEDAASYLLLCEDRYRFICSDNCQAFSFDQITALAHADLPVIPDTTAPAYVIYTSGSTGLPKGVVMPQKALINLLCSMQKMPGFGADDKLLALTTVSFDIAGLELYLPLMSGGTLVLANSEVSKDGDAIMQLISKENISVLQATPATFRLLLGFGFKGHSNLKIFCGGEPLPHDLAMDLLPKCHSLFNMYGPTETCIWSACKQITSKDTQIAIGKPIANTGILILDDKHRPVQKGKVGEIAISGAGLADGYLGKKDLTAEKFIQHPVFSDERIYLTGDLGYISETNDLFCLGRSDNQVKLRGYRIETGEIESVIVNKGGFREAVVVPKQFGKEDIRLVAFVKDIGVKNRNFKICKQTGLQLFLLEGTELEDLKNILHKDLPDYMVPAVVLAVNAMPLTPNAKTDRKFLTDLDISAMFQTGVSNAAEPLDAGKWSATELLIKPLWEAALGVSNANRLDDFFASGGHSLIAIELMHQIETKLGFKLPLSALFRKPSIAGLAQLINGESSGAYHYLVPIKSSGSNPPLYIIHGIGLEVMVFKDLAAHMDSNQPVYGVQAIGLSNKDFPPEKLEAIAAKYVEEIRAHNPKGPYLIAGHSAGSLLAYEVGRQLEKSGANIGLLGIFDYSLESSKKTVGLWPKLKYAILNVVPATLHAIKMLIRYPKDARKYYKTLLRLSVNGLLARLGKEIPDDDDPSREEFYKIMDAYINAFKKYEVMPFYGKIDLFRSQKKLYYLKDKKFLGWHPYAVKGVVIHEVDGDHDHMILGEYSEGFAHKLQRAINRSLKIHS